ncbi:hypothetical protein [Rhizobium binae]|uniref:hypothetical protein n=1 Tax=Rhizobium binae TaxID=1138190 RepID=UPI001C8383DF|nr:hypothetical protein [Rhizobium binae]MBX4944651.1 hypothetical protein [Rhizobium binae]MBX4980682.1 hypothetical protein [Rhizobium binae]
MDFLLKLIPDSLKLPIAGGVGLVLGAVLMFYPAKWIGASGERQALQIKAAAEALDRITTLEKNNANFRNLPARDRCLVFMRDSRLPEDSCDQR